jgi:hypothetical protein
MTDNKEQPDRGTSLLPGEERRRTQRVIIRMPVSLEAMESGQKIKISGFTVAVNVHGAMVLCSRPFDAWTKVEILNDLTREQASAHVTRAPREGDGGFLVPLEFEKPAPSFWQISFPPSSWKPSDV